MSALSLLSPRLRHAVIDTLRWDGLRPVQEASIPPVLAGENVVILAPTAGGKTEAAFLPALDLMLREGQRGVGLLYVSPLVALLNNQEARAETLARLVGMQAMKWHGGVGQAARRRFLDDPAEVLLTTPESLEAMLIGRNVPVSALFSQLRIIVIDEVHAFAGSDRGAHLNAVLERIAAYSLHDVQRIGLSATVLNPADIGRWMKGRSTRRGRVVRPDILSRNREAQVLAFTDHEMTQGHPFDLLLAQVSHGKSLIFVDSRVEAELIASRLHTSGSLEFVGTYHSAISLEARTQAEDAMNGDDYRHVCLACTSAMELGIDIGDLDRVLQWGTPGTVSSLLQRWGRTGRREGRPQQTTVYARNSWDMLTALAELSLAEEGWSEPVHPPRRAFHILFQQILNHVLQSGGLATSVLWPRLQGVSAFQGIDREEYDLLIRHMISTGLLSLVAGVLVLGDRAEKQLGAKRFQALITSFDTPEVYTVRDVANHFEVGQLESWFVDELRQAMEEQEQPVILLTGRAWRVLRIHDGSAALDVQVDTSGQPPKWQTGLPRLMDQRLAWRHRELLTAQHQPPWLNEVGQAQLDALRCEHTFLQGRSLPFRHTGQHVVLYTYAGTRINKTLELLLGTVLQRVSSDNFTVHGVLSPELDLERVFRLLLAAAAGIPPAHRYELTRNLKPLRLSKYQPYLPPEFAHAIVAEHLLDFEGLEAFLARCQDELRQEVG